MRRGRLGQHNLQGIERPFLVQSQEPQDEQTTKWKIKIATRTPRWIRAGDEEEDDDEESKNFGLKTRLHKTTKPPRWIDFSP